jgi:hypothetical protein
MAAIYETIDDTRDKFTALLQEKLIEVPLESE